MDTVQMTLPPSGDGISVVNELRSHCQVRLAGALYAGIMHGSLGSDEVQPYSDVDALVIIKDDHCESGVPTAKVRQQLRQLQRLFYKHDPLQHHGFFVLAENDLSHWPEHYLPTAALAQGSVFSQPHELQLQICRFFDHGKSHAAASTMVDGVRNEIQSKRFLTGMYQLKSMLSKLMLLPAMYLQVRDGHGVFKKDSYEAAKDDFGKSSWFAVEQATQIRSLWPQLKLRHPHWLFAAPGRLGSLSRRRFGYSIPDHIKALLNETFLKSTIQFVEEVGKFLLSHDRIKHNAV